jgi:hypothetical protein
MIVQSEIAECCDILSGIIDIHEESFTNGVLRRECLRLLEKLQRIRDEYVPGYVQAIDEMRKELTE